MELRADSPAGHVGARSDLDLAVGARSSEDFPTGYQEYYCHLRPEVPLDHVGSQEERYYR